MTTLQNNYDRTFVIGDIHGCFDELMDLLGRVQFSSNDRVVAVGDLVVKGPKSRDVLDLFISDNRFSSVLGNHDLAVLSYLQGKEVDYTKSQKRVARDLESDGQRYADFLSSLPLIIDLGSHVVVHAGIRPGVPLDEQDPTDLLELRTLGKKPSSRKGIPWYQLYSEDKFVLFGHWPSQMPRVGTNAMGLDTGCVYGHRLTAYLLETHELISVPSRDEYSRGSKRFYICGTPTDQTLLAHRSTESVHGVVTNS